MHLNLYNKDLIRLEYLLNVELDESEMDLVEISRELHDLIANLFPPETPKAVLTLCGLFDQTMTLPKGKVRELWNKEALEKADADSRDCEEYFLSTFEQMRLELKILLLDPNAPPNRP
jgi:hypothetical protein